VPLSPSAPMCIILVKPCMRFGQLVPHGFFFSSLHPFVTTSAYRWGRHASALPSSATCSVRPGSDACLSFLALSSPCSRALELDSLSHSCPSPLAAVCTMAWAVRSIPFHPSPGCPNLPHGFSFVPLRDEC